jgi:hypothetical protein
MAVTVTHQSGSKPATIKVPATPRVLATILALVHPQKGTHNPPHIHIQYPGG